MTYHPLSLTELRTFVEDWCDLDYSCEQIGIEQWQWQINFRSKDGGDASTAYYSTDIVDVREKAEQMRAQRRAKEGATE